MTRLLYSSARLQAHANPGTDAGFVRQIYSVSKQHKNLSTCQHTSPPCSAVQPPRRPPNHPPWDNSCFVHRVSSLCMLSHQGVPALMVCCKLTALVRDNCRLALSTHHDPAQHKVPLNKCKPQINKQTAACLSSNQHGWQSAATDDYSCAASNCK
eukprot:GHRR01037512.1.p2 GENE.GHRR01037512.1~~GHRR01037512.1.p2  ORF type:complete len:155 (+),score=28.63 GHRR01037512.1:154-618(+)